MLQIGVFENLFMEFGYGVGVVHFPRGWGWEHVLVIRMLIVLLNQEVYRFLRDGHSADGGFGFGTGECQFPLLTKIVLFPISKSSQRRATSSPLRRPLTKAR